MVLEDKKKFWFLCIEKSTFACAKVLTCSDLYSLEWMKMNLEGWWAEQTEHGLELHSHLSSTPGSYCDKLHMLVRE